MTPEAFRAALDRQGLQLDARDRDAALSTAAFLEASVERLRKAARDRVDDEPR